jgi:MoxR-like ATPase
LLITPVLSQGGQIAYHASPLVTAMITGGRLHSRRREPDE